MHERCGMARKRGQTARGEASALQSTQCTTGTVVIVSKSRYGSIYCKLITNYDVLSTFGNILR